jgi:hypothetical protein
MLLRSVSKANDKNYPVSGSGQDAGLFSPATPHQSDSSVRFLGSAERSSFKELIKELSKSPQSSSISTDVMQQIHLFFRKKNDKPPLKSARKSIADSTTFAYVSPEHMKLDHLIECPHCESHFKLGLNLHPLDD